MVLFHIVIYKCNNTSLLLSACCMMHSRCPGWQNTASSTLQANLPEFFGFDWNFLCIFLPRNFAFHNHHLKSFIWYNTLLLSTVIEGEMTSCKWVNLTQLEVHQGSQWIFASEARPVLFQLLLSYYINPKKLQIAELLWVTEFIIVHMLPHVKHSLTTNSCLLSSALISRY